MRSCLMRKAGQLLMCLSGQEIHFKLKNSKSKRTEGWELLCPTDWNIWKIQQKHSVCLHFCPAPSSLTALPAEKAINKDLKDLKNKTKSNTQEKKKKKNHKITKLKYFPDWNSVSWCAHDVWEPAERKVRLRIRGMENEPNITVQMFMAETEMQDWQGTASTVPRLCTQSQPAHILQNSLLIFCRDPRAVQRLQFCYQAIIDGRKKRIPSMKWTPGSAKEQSSSWADLSSDPHLCTLTQPLWVFVAAAWAFFPSRVRGFLKLILILLIHITTLHLAAGSVPNTEFVQPTITILIFNGYIH